MVKICVLLFTILRIIRKDNPRSFHGILRRSISDAVYLKNHPDGDPFTFELPQTIEQVKLYGMGLGLYWGEGNKTNKSSIRLANTDPGLIRMFIRFLLEIFQIKKQDLKFSLQIFTDMSPEESLNYWLQQLQVKREQFYKTVVTPSHSLGTYRNKSQHGVIIVYYHNRKLRDIICNNIEKMR